MVTLTEEDWRKLDDCILKIHTTEALDAMQRQFMEDLDGLIPNQKSFFDLCSYKDGQFYFFHPVSVNMTVEQITSYYKQYQFSDYVAIPTSPSSTATQISSAILSGKIP